MGTTRLPDSDTAGPGRERLYTYAEFGEITNTSERFGRRLVAERRIRFVKLGHYVRIPASAVEEFLAAGTVDVDRWERARALAERTRAAQGLPPTVEDPAALEQVARILGPGRVDR